MYLAEMENLILQGQPSRAAELLEQVMKREPLNAAALHLWGLAAIAESALHTGIARIEDAVALNPDPYWRRDLGAAYLAAGLADQAVRSLDKALAALPADAETRLLMGRALAANGNAAKAVELLDGIRCTTNDARLLRALGEALFGSGQRAQALERFTEACELDPNSLNGREWCALTALSLARFDVALAQRRAIMSQTPDDCRAQCSLSSALWSAGEMDECMDVSRRARDAFPEDEQAHLNWLRVVDHTTFDPAASRTAWREWAEVSRQDKHRLPLRLDQLKNSERPLRVGYLLDEVQRRPNSYFTAPLLREHSKAGFEVFCYLASPTVGEVWDELQDLGHHLRDARRLPLEELARMIYADRIDILVNLSWEFRHRHVAVFGHRAAPVQIELAHYPGTTGHPDTDYILTDEWICPAGREEMYTEGVRRLKHSYMAWDPQTVAPKVSASPASSNGYCTFGLFQRPAKLNAAFWDAVGEILRAEPSSRLLIHQNSDELERVSSATRTALERQLSTRGVNPDRASFVGARSHAEHFAVVGKCDVALDSFPYNGTTTTGDCLWMGVPVVNLVCDTHAGRVGYSMLSRLGLEAWAAGTTASYVETALQLARDFKGLAQTQRSLRKRMRESVLTDVRTVMSGIEAEYRYIWRERCANAQEGNS